MKLFNLKRQLRAASSLGDEPKQLAAIARQISGIEMPALDKTAKREIAAQIGFGRQRRQLALVRRWESAVAVLVIVLLVFAQSAKPGSALYSVRKGTNSVRSFVQDKVPFIDNSGHDSARDQIENQTGQTGSGSGGSGSNSGRGGSGSNDNFGGSGGGSGKLEDKNINSGSGGSGSSGDGSGTSGGSGSGSGKDLNKIEDH
jgi:hypothetical protein